MPSPTLQPAGTLATGAAWARLGATLLAATAAGAVLQVVGLPAAWMMGPLLASMLLSLLGVGSAIPTWAQRIGQSVIGLNVASNFTHDVAVELARSWAEVAGAVVGTLALGLATGLLLARLARMERVTALLGFIPGAASGMVAMSADMGGNPPIVAIIQYIRLLVVLLSAPIIMAWFGPEAAMVTGPGGPPLGSAGPVAAGGQAVAVAITLAAGVVGFLVSLRSRIPSGALLFPIALLIGASLAGLPHAPVPAWAGSTALAILGTWVGARFQRPVLNQAGRATGWIVLLAVLLAVACGVVGWALHHLAGIPLLAAVLATAPGAIETMTALALAAGQLPGLVVSVQLVRLLAALAVGPVLVAWVAGTARRPTRPPGRTAGTFTAAAAGSLAPPRGRTAGEPPGSPRP